MSVNQPELDAIVKGLLTTSTFLDTWHRLESVPRAYRERGVIAAIQGEVVIEERTVTILIGFRKSFPLSLPLVFVTPYNALGLIPHVDEDGNVCYMRGDGQFINYHDPLTVVQNALSRSIITITQGYKGENRADFINGFAEYWSRLQGTIAGMSLVTPGDSFQKVVQATTTSGNKEKTDYFADNEQTIRSLTLRLKKQTFTTRTVLYIPLESTTPLIPPNYGSMWSLKEVQELVQTRASAATKAELRRETQKWKVIESVVFGLRRPSGGWVLFGVKFTGVRVAHPLITGSSVKKISPIILQRLDQEYLMTRGGSDFDLRNKHVAVIGCGSVGGNVAYALAQSGVGQLTLVDNDILTPENVFRHLVGYYRIGAQKVSAVKTDLEMRVPYIQVTALTERIETLIRSNKISWSSYDLIIVATGEPTINLYINELLHQQAQNTPVLFTWLDPYGIGGHALLQYTDQPGCLQCLYQFTEDGHLNNRASFAEPGQSFLKDIAGCGGSFTPFGALDVIQTAQIAVRLALVALTAGGSNQVVSWKGDTTSFIDQGYKLADRYGQDQQTLTAQGTEFKRINCPVCNRK